MTEQQNFEFWAKDHKFQTSKDNLGLYSNTHTQSAWEAWKARAKLNDQSTEQEANATT